MTTSEQIASLNQSADYLASKNLLLGKIKPIFQETQNGKFELSLNPVESQLKKLSISKESAQGLSIVNDYLLDAENVIKRTAQTIVK